MATTSKNHQAFQTGHQLTGAPWLFHTQPKAVSTKKNHHPRNIRGLLKRSMLLIIVVLLASGGFTIVKLYQNASKVTGDKNPLSLLSSFRPSTLAETNGRVNILLAGYSADDPGHQGADLTDSIMILSVDPTTKSAVMMSIPRDLYVNIPGFGYSKINAAYEDGQSSTFIKTGYPSGGMGLLEDTLNQDFGVSFNYDALINYAAFEDAVNAVGGVSVTIASSDPRGLYDPNTNLNLPNGTVILHGQQALDLARARGDGAGSYGFPEGDFNRTQHQQQLLIAVKDKASSVAVIANPLKIAGIIDAIGNNATTNMTIGEMETLYTKVKGINDGAITSVTLNNYQGQDLLTDYTTDDGEDALLPADGIGNYSAIRTVVSNVFGISSQN